MTDNDTTAAVAAALSRAKTEQLFGRGKQVDVVGQMLVRVQQDRAVLAQEVERLRETLSQVIYAWEQNDRFTATMLEAKQLLRDTHPATAGRGSED